MRSRRPRRSKRADRRTRSAGGAAHLAGVIAAHTTLPVIGVPIPATSLNGMDSLLATVQMPAGIPVATVAIGKPGATNAGILAAQMIALADADLPLARERAASMYREGMASEDMPLLASVGSALAHLARALGQPGRAAEILGACAAVRGGEDLTDPTVTLLGPQLREALGPDGYDRAYAAGTALDRAEAISRLDPATL